MASSRTALIPLLLAVACQRLDIESDDEGPSPSGGSLGTTDDDLTLTLDPGESGDSEDETGAPTTFECDPIAQTGCNPNEKCSAVAQSGAIAYVCVLDDESLDPFAPCQPSPSGADGCPAGYACIADPSEAALCVPLCLDSGDCDGGVCLLDLVEQIPYCADECSPFEGGCAAPLQCRRGSDGFACAFAQTNDVGGQDEPCAIDQDAGCGQGFVCLPGALVPQCGAANCCTVVCDLLLGGCDEPSTCVPLFESPSPGVEDIGACLVPS